MGYVPKKTNYLYSSGDPEPKLSAKQRAVLKAIVAAVDRLEASSTALTRKRSRSALRKATTAALRVFPVIDTNGNPTAAASRPGVVCRCPLCNGPMRSWSAFIVHLNRRHEIKSAPAPVIKRRKRFGVGKYSPRSARYESFQKAGTRCPGCGIGYGDLAKHLSAINRRGTLTEHVVMAATRKTFAKPSESQQPPF